MLPVSLTPVQEAEAQWLAERWCLQLKHEGGASLLAKLQSLDRSDDFHHAGAI